jgi:hypothetical protein
MYILCCFACLIGFNAYLDTMTLESVLQFTAASLYSSTINRGYTAQLHRLFFQSVYAAETISFRVDFSPSTNKTQNFKY